MQDRIKKSKIEKIRIKIAEKIILNLEIIGVIGNLPHRSTILLGVIIESSASLERLRWICSISKSGRLCDEVQYGVSLVFK